MTPAGQRNQRVTFQRNAGAEDELGGEGPEAWTDLFSAFAQVRFGTSAERRAAAGEQAVQSATVRVLANPAALGVTVQDRVQARGLTWDITGIALVGGPAAKEIEFTVMASRG
jgi:head-tail adaptor